jgi:hypothetical protein
MASQEDKDYNQCGFRVMESTNSYYQEDLELERLYQAIVLEPKYAHFVRIPERIIRCLDHFTVKCDPIEVKKRLLSYYIFIGVVDETIDYGGLETGKQILERFNIRTPCLDEKTQRSAVELTTEILKRNISRDVYQATRAKLHELYRAVVRERTAETMTVYIEQRSAVGSLTAEVSYLLIQPFLERSHADILRFLKSVGSVGCLVDSIVDLSADAKNGILSFQPSARDLLKLISRTLREALVISLRHPALLGLFMKAVVDILRDRFRSAKPSSRVLVGAARKESAASVV